MKILLLHNRYQQPGGEDVVVRAERELLQNHGHDVDLLEADNSEIVGFTGQVKAALGTIYSPAAKSHVAGRIASFRPDVVHVHNFFPLFSPSIYYACLEAEVPVVQTLHNYRLLCPNALLFRDGRVCEDCVGRTFAWPAITHRCYRGSSAGTATVAAMQAVHRMAGTWNRNVDLYIALTEFCRDKLVQGGLPAGKIAVKPNFVSSIMCKGGGLGEYALFVGRLSQEKGIDTLLAAWKLLKGRHQLRIVGDGPLANRVHAAAAEGISYLGPCERDAVLNLMKDASFLIVPSEWYENLPMVIVEAFAAGMPVIASNLGSLGSLVSHGRTGLLFRPGDPAALVEQIEWAICHPSELSEMRQAARAEYEAMYTPERNYEMVMAIYKRVLRLQEQSDLAVPVLPA